MIGGTMNRMIFLLAAADTVFASTNETYGLTILVLQFIVFVMGARVSKSKC